MDPRSTVIFKWIGWNYERKGMKREAARFDLQDQINIGRSPENAKALEEVLTSSGPDRYWEELLKIKLRSRKITEIFETARINARLGCKDQAFAWLNVACEQHVSWITWSKVDPTLDPLRSEPRFVEVLRCINM